MSTNDIAISARGLSKAYTIAHQAAKATTMGEALARRLRNPLQRVDRETFWALKGVSFDIREGEAVGIIGRNGAGKSTLLKILSEITEPTAGSVELYGRVGSLLEVGTGFHPELTGRENIYLNGAILGMRQREIDRQFDAIVDFAEVERFLDTPVKRYSSGMYVRLAFAVAAHLDPEILVVDEVLAVGDATFQKKCLGKMGEVATQGGRTVLFVSHNMAAVQSLCNRAIWLHRGQICEDGDPRSVVATYLGTSFSPLTEQFWPDMATAPGNEKVRMHRACVRPLAGVSTDPITVSTPLAVEFEFWNLSPDALLNLSVGLINEQGVAVFYSGPVAEPVWAGRPYPRGLFRSGFTVPGDLLNDGVHQVHLLVVQDGSVVIYNHSDVLSFEVRDALELRDGWYGKWPGAVRPDLEWHTELLEELPVTSRVAPVAV